MARLIVLVLLTSLAAPALAQTPDLPIEPRFLFPVSLLCGPSGEGVQEGVVSGHYQTVIHVANPSLEREVRIAKTVVPTLPYQTGRPPGVIASDRLSPLGAMAIECNELRQMQDGSMAQAFRTGFLVIWSDGPLDVSAGWTGAPRGGEVATTTQAAIGGTELCPFELGTPTPAPQVDRICLPFSWTCENPERLSLAIDGEPRGTISLARTEDYLLGDGSSTMCASTRDFADGTHTLAATFACEATAPCTIERSFEVANTRFRLLSARADRKRYRGSDTVHIEVVFSEAVDALDADFTRLDTGFDEDRLTIEETATPGRYLISYDIDPFDNTNPVGIYPIPIIATDQGVTRRYDGLRVGYVGETRNLLAPVDTVPTSTRVGRLPTTGTSERAGIAEIAASASVILPLTSVTVTGTVGGTFVEGRPRADVEAEARNFTLIWRERDSSAAGAHRLRPAMLELDCDDFGAEICNGATFTVELGFPARLNEIAKEGPHARTIDFALVDPEGGVSEIASVPLRLAVLSEEMYSGTPQTSGGASSAGTLGNGVSFRLGDGLPGDFEANLMTLILTWDGETGPGAEVVPGEDGNPQTLTALDLNIGLHRAPANGHGGWFGNLGNAELVRKSNTCFSGLGLGQFSDDRWNCVCSDASDLNMEVITYPADTELDVGGDGAGTFGAEYYIYDSCGSQQDTVATLTAYYCGSFEQHSFEINAALSEENEELNQNWNNACLFGSPCHDPKEVPTGFNETGGFHQGFDFNPTDCSRLPLVAGHVGYFAPVNRAVNNPAAAPPELQNADPALDQSWSFFDNSLNEGDWSRFDVPFAKIEVRLADGSEALVGETFTDEDGYFSLILPADFAEGGESGQVRVEIVALSPEPHNYRIVESQDDVGETGTDVLYRGLIADGFDPVANGGAPIEAMLNAGPEDEANKEIAAAFHIFRNSIVAAQYVLSLGRLVPPYTVVYDRDQVNIDAATCAALPSFYSGDFTHIRSIPDETPVPVCNMPLAANGTCPGACVPNGEGQTLDESRADFAYDTHMHEYAHHVFTQLTSIGPRRFEDRAEASHFGTTSEKTSLTEGIGEAFGMMLVSKEVFNQYGAGVAMFTTQTSCNRDDILDCDLGIIESVDWLTVRDKSDIVRPGPDWQPQKDCAPGQPGCGCFLGTCAQAGTACQAGYCVDTTGACTPGTLGCAVGSGCSAEGAAEIGANCLLPVTYSDGWTWRMLWDLIDEGEDVQPEVSHWRTSQMSETDPAVPNPYDRFGDPEGFWRLVLRTTGNEAVNPVSPGSTRPNLADLITEYRCSLDDEARAALDTYLEVVVEFPYHDPTVCP